MSIGESMEQAKVPARWSRLRGTGVVALILITAAAGLAAGCSSHGQGAPLSGQKQAAAVQADNVLEQMAKSSSGNFNNLSPTDRQKLIQIMGRQAPIALRQKYSVMVMQGTAK